MLSCRTESICILLFKFRDVACNEKLTQTVPLGGEPLLSEKLKSAIIKTAWKEDFEISEEVYSWHGRVYFTGSLELLNLFLSTVTLAPLDQAADGHRHVSSGLAMEHLVCWLRLPRYLPYRCRQLSDGAGPFSGAKRQARIWGISWSSDRHCSGLRSMSRYVNFVCLSLSTISAEVFKRLKGY